MIYGVILAGGKGERFWPLSRQNRPKQFLKLTSTNMMLEETIDRVLPLISMDRIRVVTGERMKDLILANLDGITDDHIFTEPVGRNTAPAIGLAAVHLLREDPEAVMVVLSADHLIRPRDKLLSILEAAAGIAVRDDTLITIGIVPTRPETAYGYIKIGDLYRHEGSHKAHQVAAFTEKPSEAVAHEYYYSNQYLWNSGMFVWSARSILDAIDECHPALGKALGEYRDKLGTDKEDGAREALYEDIKSISIDFAVLEKATNVLTIRADIVWDDVGDWRALERYKEMDRENNVTVGKVVTFDTYESTLCNYSDGLIACLGVSDLIVVRADNIVMVAHKTKAQEIKKLLAQMKDDEETSDYL